MDNKNNSLLPLWLIVIFFAIVALYLAKSLIIMLLFVAILLFIFTGIFNFFAKYIKSQLVSGMVTWAIFLIFFTVIGYIITSQVEAFVKDFWNIQVGLNTFLERYSFVGEYLANFDIASMLSSVDFTGIWSYAVSLVAGIIWWLGTVWFLLLFLMIEKNVFITKIREIFWRQWGRKLSEVYTRIYQDMNIFFLSKFSLALFNAFVSWIVMYFFGLEYALMFALLVFLLDFIPVIGAIVALMLPFLYSFVVFDSSGTSFLLLACLLIPQFISANIIEPKLMGDRLNLSSFVILLALVIWSSFWWLAGAFLAVPLMATCNIIFAQFESTRSIAILLSKNGKI